MNSILCQNHEESFFFNVFVPHKTIHKFGNSVWYIQIEKELNFLKFESLKVRMKHARL